jgi:hypothetical protein
MSSSRKELERAFKLIKRDEIDEALGILRPVVQNEPDNVDAWWLLAYAATEPHEVREALITVLRLDPNYKNAPKARDMLEKINQEYPPDPDEVMRFPDELQPYAVAANAYDNNVDLFAASDSFEPFDEYSPEENAFTPNFFGEQEELVVDEPFTPLQGGDPFALEEDEAFAAEVPAKKIKPKKQRIKAVEFEPEIVDEETLAGQEERLGRRQGRSKRFLFGLIIAAAIVAVILFAVMLVSSGNDETKEVSDPGPLQVIEANSEPMINVLSATDLDLRSSSLAGDPHAVMATSDLGDTLFIEVCGQSTPDLTDTIQRSMEIAARQAPLLEGQAAAVGVTIKNCQSEQQDTLYRAVVPVNDAINYLEGTIDWPTFGSRWKSV